MIPVPAGVHVWIATGFTDMRAGMNGLALRVQQVLQRDPHTGDLFVFRGKFVWPVTTGDPVTISPAQLGYMLEGIEWRHPQRTYQPELAG